MNAKGQQGKFDVDKYIEKWLGQSKWVSYFNFYLLAYCANFSLVQSFSGPSQVCLC